MEKAMTEKMIKRFLLLSRMEAKKLDKLYKGLKINNFRHDATNKAKIINEIMTWTFDDHYDRKVIEGLIDLPL